MRIAFVYDVRANVFNVSDGPVAELATELFSPAQANDLIAAIKELGHEVEVVEGAMPFAQRVSTLRTTVDFVFNEAKGIFGADRKMAVPALCRIHGMPFLGTSAYGVMLSRNKWHTSAIARQAGIPIPRSILFGDASEVARSRWRDFPALVKPNFESASIGMTDQSLVHSHSELISQVENVTSTYRQPALVQSFIAGYEIQVSIIGTENPRPLGYILLTVQDEIGARREWIRKQDWDRRHVSFQPFTDRTLCARILRYCRRLYPTLDIQDYGRLDYRLTPEGKIYFIESSTHPHLTRRSSFFTAAQSKGHDFTSMIELLLFESGTRQGLSLNPPRIPCP